jgi:hypothetical protein
MRRFVPGGGAHLGTSISAALIRSSAPESREALIGLLRSQAGSMTLITGTGTSLSERYRQVCYWRQVVNAHTN